MEPTFTVLIQIGPPVTQALPEWLSISVAIADVAWKIALIAAAIAFSPKVWTAIRTWQQIKSAQIESERDIEKKQREGAERDVARIQRVVETFETERSVLLQRVQESNEIRKAYEDSTRLVEKEAPVNEHEKVLGRALFEAIYLGIKLDVSVVVLQQSSKEASQVATPLSAYLTTLNLPDAVMKAYERLTQFSFETDKYVKYYSDALQHIILALQEVVPDADDQIKSIAYWFQEREEEQLTLRMVKRLRDEGHEMPIVDEFLVPYLADELGISDALTVELTDVADEESANQDD